MFTALSHCFKNIILFSTFLLGVSVSCASYAGPTDSCFSFIDAQKYVLAEAEAHILIKREDLNLADQRFAYMCHGIALFKQERMKESLSSWHKVEELSKNTKKLIPSSYHQLSEIYRKLGDLNRAEWYAQRFYKFALEEGDRSSEVTASSDLKEIANVRGASERALNLYRESLAMKSEVEQSSILNNIAMTHADRKEYSQAIGLLRQAIEIARSRDYKHQMAICQINLGYVLMGDKQYGAAGDELIAGLDFMKLVGDKHWQGVASGNPPSN